MTITMWDLAKAVGLAIVQLNAATLALSIVAGPFFQMYDVWEAYRGR